MIGTTVLGLVKAIVNGVRSFHEKVDRRNQAQMERRNSNGVRSLFHDTTNRRPPEALDTSRNEGSSGEPTPMTPTLLPSPREGEHEYFYDPGRRLPVGVEEQSPGVYTYKAPSPEMYSKLPYTAEEDETATMVKPDWESEEEETPPSSPKGIAPKPALLTKPGHCPGCQKKFKWPSRREHQCRVCISLKCSKCTNVGCGFPWVACGDKCICHECDKRLKRAKRVRAMIDMRRFAIWCNSVLTGAA